jgi:RIO-like serine/threonine protein kinase
MAVHPPTLPQGLPRGIDVGPQLGRGRRSIVYAGSWDGQEVVLKCYTDDAVQKYRRKYRVSIARFEYQRNASFWQIPALRPCVARPLHVMSADSGNSEVFIQQRVNGRELREFLNAQRRLPDEVLSVIGRVVDFAARHKLFDIDMSPSNFLMQPEGAGWRPVLFDFNLMPQHLHPPNPWVKLQYRLGMRQPSHRDQWMLNRLKTWPD